MKISPILLLGILCINCSNLNSGKVVNRSTKMTAEQIELVNKHVQDFPGNSEFSIALIENGEVIYAGVKRTKDTIVAIENQQSIFEIGSISKVFTATLLADLVEKGQVKLEDAVQDHLDVEFKASDKISFQNLSNHTSGLPRLPTNLYLDQVDQDNPYKDYGIKELESYLRQEMELSQTPGSKNEYSNLGAGLLGYVMTQMTNLEYEDLLQQNICSKYEMSNTTTTREKVKDKLTLGQSPAGEITSNWDMNVLVGAGGILSSTEDLVKFALAHFKMSNTNLKLTQAPTFTLNQTMKIGLGWHLINEGKGKQMIWHNGGTGGYTSSMALDVENQDGIIILSNVSAFHPKMNQIDQLCFDLMATL